MITTIRKCDRCKQERKKDPDFLWNLALAKGRGTTPQLLTPGVFVQFCRSCMVELGLLPSVKDDPPAPDPKPTALEIVELLAEKLRELES